MIVAAVSPKLLDALRRAGLPDIQRVTLVGQTVQELRLGGGDLLVLDPTQLRGDADRTAELARALVKRGVRCAFFTEFSPANMRAVGSAVALAPAALWIAGIDDLVPTFRERLLGLARHEVVSDTLALLRPALGRLPAALAGAIETLFQQPERFFDARDLGSAANMSRRATDRHLASKGFTTASRVVVAAKLLHAAARLQQGGTTVRAVAESLGYSAHEVLARQCVRVLGCPLRCLAMYSRDRLSRGMTAIICSGPGVAYLAATIRSTSVVDELVWGQN